MKRAIFRMLVAALAGLVAIAEVTPVGAETTWSGPGWYQTFSDPTGDWLEAGPFESQGNCEANLPEIDPEWESIDCEYLETAP